MRYWISLALIFFINGSLKSAPVRVVTQHQFDTIVDRVNNGEALSIQLASRRFVLKKQIVSTAPLYIIGQGASITCSTVQYCKEDALRETEHHYVCLLKEKLSYYPVFYDENDKWISVSESVIGSIGVNLIEGQIIGPHIFAIGSSFQIPIPSNLERLKNKTYYAAFGYLDCGWDVAKFNLTRSDNNYLYCNVIAFSTIDNMRYDSQAYKKPIRFVLYNVELRDKAVYYDSKYIYIPKSLNVLHCYQRDNLITQNADIIATSDFYLKGIKFIGFDGIEVRSVGNDVCDIQQCRFQYTLGRTLYVFKKYNGSLQEANITNCEFESCSVFADQVVFLKSSFENGNCINISGCTVSKYPEAMVTYKNPRAGIYAIGNITVCGNVVYNQCRDHLFLNQGHIVAYNNVVFNTDEFNSYSQRNYSSDFGLIYCAHVFKDTQAAIKNTTNTILLENNLLYGAYAYGEDARGIFIDDGRGDVTCRGNIVLNTQIYSIDARNSNLTKASSIRNRYESNVVTTKYRLVSGESVNGNDIPIISKNLLLTRDENITGNIRELEADTRKDVKYTCSCDGNKIKVSEDLFRELRKSMAWKSVRKFVERK